MTEPTIFLISNNSSASGKTTTALNLALALSCNGKSVLLVSYKSKGCLDKLFKANFESHGFLDYIKTSHILFDQLDKYEFVVYDVDFHNLIDFKGHNYRLIIPVELEFYGIQPLQNFLSFCQKNKFEIEGVLPVMLRTGEVSQVVLQSLKDDLGWVLFNSYIQRNFYLARQFDFEGFDLEKLTEMAATTFLNFASEIIERTIAINGE